MAAADATVSLSGVGITTGSASVRGVVAGVRIDDATRGRDRGRVGEGPGRAGVHGPAEEVGHARAHGQGDRVVDAARPARGAGPATGARCTSRWRRVRAAGTVSVTGRRWGRRTRVRGHDRVGDGLARLDRRHAVVLRDRQVGGGDDRVRIRRAVVAGDGIGHRGRRGRGGGVRQRARRRRTERPRLAVYVTVPPGGSTTVRLIKVSPAGRSSSNWRRPSPRRSS